eukprot:TRINITY_DN1925_c0_g1_i4.p1 TRINITY_DN1925_c0_g1~~TRINITY_DN1925_c0_g1_i4.p1  ORF type:complete len:139 (-),score=53.64 TRINITY_DN1925_c0_g1_i4:18-434(-)
MFFLFFLQMFRRPPRSTLSSSSAASDVYKRQVYEYPPPEMRKGCEAFYAAHYDVLERELIKRIDNDSIEERICVKVTKACKGVDFEAKRQENLKKQKEQVDKRAKEDQQRQEEEEKQKEKQKQEQAEEVDLDLQQEDL